MKVKKNNSNNWITANYDTALEKGDVVQTTTEGMAKIVFTDGTNYTVKQDSLIVVEENSTNKDQQTNVAVQVSTGTVDLSTATFTQGSKSEVRVAGASASLAPESSASVRTRSRRKMSTRSLLKRGSASVDRGRRNREARRLRKGRLQDRQEADGARQGGAAALPGFAFEHVPDLHGRRWRERAICLDGGGAGQIYRLRLSRNPYFSDVILERQLDTTNLSVTGLGAGRLLLGSAGHRRGRQAVGGEREESLHDRAEEYLEGRAGA